VCGACIYCGRTAGGEKSVGDGCDAPATASSLIEGKTRKRRKVDGVRKKHKMGKWWRVYGYGGEAYCQRCSEVFRDHIMRQKSNSAKCTPGLLTQGVPGVPPDPLAPHRGPLGSSADRERAIGNAPALVAGPLAPL
jgi:hypothetical protein